MKRTSAHTEPPSDQLALWPEPPSPGPGTLRSARAVGDDRLWSIKDVDQFLGVPVATIYQWRVRGEGPPATKLGKHLRYEPGVVRAWVSEHRDGA
jgi:predicted DNA-binding transcriptional regulator AlpA